MGTGPRCGVVHGGYVEVAAGGGGRPDVHRDVGLGDVARAGAAEHRDALDPQPA
jgi:hypothetical protein